jgi:hypothetical protein
VRLEGFETGRGGGRPVTGDRGAIVTTDDRRAVGETRGDGLSGENVEATNDVVGRVAPDCEGHALGHRMTRRALGRPN